MQPPTTKKSMQKLIGRLAALSRFISRSTEKSLPFFEVLKGTNPIEWGPKQQKAFEELKSYLINLTTLSPLEHGATLLLYIAAAPSAVNAVLVQEKQVDGQKKQLPVYFVSKALTPTKSNYSEIEKIAYVVVMASRKLRHYFQAHKIMVPSSQPLNDVLRNREASGRIGKWAAELNEFVLDFIHRLLPRHMYKYFISFCVFFTIFMRQLYLLLTIITNYCGFCNIVLEICYM